MMNLQRNAVLLVLASGVGTSVLISNRLLASF